MAQHSVTVNAAINKVFGSSSITGYQYGVVKDNGLQWKKSSSRKRIKQMPVFEPGDRSLIAYLEIECGPWWQSQPGPSAKRLIAFSHLAFEDQ